uniref:Chromosome 1 open reading frame 43 n=1 Tax=Leptobrachium leishanense TaxID=445787 RepID=A0A8C5WF93_9ANUR
MAPKPSNSNWLSGVNVVLVMAYGSLVFVLLFIFVKRQIMRFAMKSRRGPHVPVGHNAPKDLKEEIDIRLSKVQDIRFEPRLLDEGDVRMLQLDRPEQEGCYNYLYRMKTLDSIKDSDIPFQDNGKHPRTLVGKNFRSYLLELRNSSSPYRGIRKALIDSLLDGYDSARYGTGELFGYHMPASSVNLSFSKVKQSHMESPAFQNSEMADYGKQQTLRRARMRQEIMMANKELVMVRRAALQRLLQEEYRQYSEELSRQGRCFYIQRL